MSQTVVGIFDSVHDAQLAADHLVSAGFQRDKIDVSISRTDGTYDKTITEQSHKEESFTDSISNFFSNLFSDDETESKRYAEVARSGHLVTVHTNSRDESELASKILDQYGTIDVSQRMSTSGMGTSEAGTMGVGSSGIGTSVIGSSGMNAGTTQVPNNTTDTSSAIPVIEEELQVGKREIETGRVSVRSRIVERPVEESLRLREERVWVERNPVNRPATDAEMSNLRGETIEVTQHAEIPVVAKEARVVEEIRVGKAVQEHEQTIQDTVRKTEVDVDENRERNDVSLSGNQ